MPCLGKTCCVNRISFSDTFVGQEKFDLWLVEGEGLEAVAIIAKGEDGDFGQRTVLHGMAVPEFANLGEGHAGVERKAVACLQELETALESLVAKVPGLETSLHRLPELRLPIDLAVDKSPVNLELDFAKAG